MRVQHNIMAMNAYRNYNGNNSALSKNLEKLSSGYAINRAGDDAAGLAISEKMRAQITGLSTAQDNAQSGINLVQTAEGALTEVHDMLNRMYELSNQSANGTYDEIDREQLQKEVEQLSEEIDRIADSTNFNGIQLLDGSLGGGKISADGATFTGAEVAKYTEAKASLDISGDLSTLVAGKDTFIIDGQSLVIDWSKGDAKKVLDAFKVDFGANAANTSTRENLAEQLEKLINDQMKEQGLKGEVKITDGGNGKLNIESTLKDAKSEITFAGTDKAANPSTSLGAVLFGSSDGDSVIHEATKKYNGDSIKAGDKFIMDINGVKVKVSIGTAIDKDTTTMSAAAGTIETAIKAAVAAYNTQMGLQSGVKDSKSGLTGLKQADFTVEEKDGSFVINYNGSVEDVNFSFSDVGEKTIASSLGLANGSSKSGGATGLTLQIGDTSDSYNQLNVSVKDVHIRSLGLNSIDISTQNGANAASDLIKDAINEVSDVRGTLGAAQNRLEHTINNLSVTEENITASESSIRDTDVAEEMMAYTKNNILVQSAQAMLAQANQVPQGVLQLLG